jgi:predicted nucleic acid-binding protein
VIHFDTTFFIDLERELARERPGPAFTFLEELDDQEILKVSVLVVAELRFGAELTRKPDKAHAALNDLVEGLLVSYPGEGFAARYAREAAAIRRGGWTVSRMDLLIGTAALLDEAPLVTRDVKDFSKVPGLRVLSYSA